LREKENWSDGTDVGRERLLCINIRKRDFSTSWGTTSRAGKDLISVVVRRASFQKVTGSFEGKRSGDRQEERGQSGKKAGRKINLSIYLKRADD